MISSNQVIVTGGQFSQNHYHGQASVGTKAPIDILTDAVAPSAFHDSGARFDPPKCHPGTRVKILALIMRWIVGQDEENRAKPFMWLNGAAGCGKSAIAQSTNGPLAAYRSNDSSTQFRTPFLVLIDGLDECEDCTSQKAILTGLADCLRSFPSCIRVFIASRPQHDIKLSFGSKYLKDVHIHLPLDLDDESQAGLDIKLYFLDRFAEIQEDFDNRTSGKKLGQSWPGEELVKRLVKKSSGQFIYAATVIRFVQSTRHRPDHRLDIVMNLRPHEDGDHSFAELDALYTVILESSSNMDKVLSVLSLHLRDSNKIWCSVIEMLLQYEEGELETLFCDLGALVEITEFRHHTNQPSIPEQPQRYLHVLHASLYDYLVDIARPKQFRIDIHRETINHTTYILQYLASCCSSSFDPSSNPAATLLRIFSSNAHICRWGAISLELRQAALSFPLKRFLEPHITTYTFIILLKYFVCPFLDLLGIIAEKDSQWSHIRDYQHEALESVLNPQIKRYLANDRLAAMLVLFRHLGCHRFVPVLRSDIRFSRGNHSSPFTTFDVFVESDTLSLSYFWIGFTAVDEGARVPFKHNFYHDYVRHLLSNPGAAQWALGPETYEKAVLYCFQEILRSEPSPDESVLAQNTAILNEEDDGHPLLMFNDEDGEWNFQCSVSFLAEGHYFVLLGYIIFLLPRCGRSQALISACEKQKARFLDQPGLPFPIRRRRLHVEIDNYLDRALANSNL
ncbi:hypothetical protein CPC08DRAFT_799917 [Agrocybe pediades]|nr:hypothetical protein CPC08DRAFT_799917 [Agrocybe pediades]